MTARPARRIRSVVDLDAESRRALEFDALLDGVAAFARTRAGGARIRALEPAADSSEVAEALRALDEARRYVAEHGTLLPGMLPDPAPALAGLAVAGLILEPLPLRDLAVFLSAATEIQQRMDSPAGERFEILRALAEDLPYVDIECREVLAGIDPQGRILDAASPELRRIRLTLSRVGARLRSLLEGILRDPDAEAIVRDDFITQRNGRFVIPIRSDAPRPLAGIVHARSGSGATRFIEPLQSVEMNNELVRLAEEEQEEQERVLAAWSERFRSRLDELDRAVDTLTELDDLQARALFAREWQAVIPQVVEGGPLRLNAVRHPLLERHLQEQGSRSVPLDVRLDPADQILVLSGPNTGGKTIALKTLGLAALMAQSGLPVLATAVELPLFRQIRADIGDHQSILEDMSTFSAHVRAVVELLAAPVGPALFLFDEIGTGTEPSEGAALARAVLESLQQPGITAVATTHLGALKAWAFAADGATCAAMDFDTQSLRPTFRLLMGTAGTSAGLDIAERLGLQKEIVGRARELLSPDAREGESYLRRLGQLVAELEHEREAAAEQRSALDAERRRLETRMEGEAAKQRERAARELDQALNEFKKLAKKELGELQERREQVKLDRQQQRAMLRVEQDHAQRKRALAGAEPDGAPQGWAPDGPLEPGARVWVTSLRKEGRVKEARGDKVDVQLGSVVLSIGRTELLVAPTAAKPSAASAAKTTTPAPGKRKPEPHATVDPQRSIPLATRELQLIGKRVDEALEELDKFLDIALKDGHEVVRIVHGHGTGRLRTAVRRFLREHAGVLRHAQGGPGEGGDGSTIVELR